jgi:hypothetical protein
VLFQLRRSINSRARLPRFDAGHEHGKERNEFAAHEHLPFFTAGGKSLKMNTETNTYAK